MTKNRKGILPVLYSCLAVLFLFACGEKASVTHPNHPVFKNPQVIALNEDIEDDPANAKRWFARGNMLRKLNEDSFALRDYQQAARLDSTKAEYFSAVGDLMFEHKDISGSVPWIEKAVKLNPNDPTAHLKMAKLFIYIKDYTKAFSEINTVLRQNTMNPEGYFLKGMIYKDLKDTAKSISSFQTTIQIAPEHHDALVQLGLLYCAKGDALGLKYLDNAYRVDSTDVFPLYARGMYFQQREQYEEAKREYQRCISRDADFGDAWFGKGWVLLQQDSVEQARDQFDIVARLQPTRATAWYNRGLCNELLGQRQDAINDYKQALVFQPEYAEAANGLKRLGQ
ncbi:MAG: tetratricopeptide repeat protein [Sphingobacteriales bacterium]|nr:MAG: tetratricopeptide repeat protein [Sphingobacteriales bacterium]